MGEINRSWPLSPTCNEQWKTLLSGHWASMTHGTRKYIYKHGSWLEIHDKEQRFRLCLHLCAHIKKNPFCWGKKCPMQMKVRQLRANVFHLSIYLTFTMTWRCGVEQHIMALKHDANMMSTALDKLAWYIMPNDTPMIVGIGQWSKRSPYEHVTNIAKLG